MKPLHIFQSALSGKYYATRAYKNCGEGLFQVTGNKEDVTEQINGLRREALLEGVRLGLEAAAAKAASLYVSLCEYDADVEEAIRAIKPEDVTGRVGK